MYLNFRRQMNEKKQFRDHFFSNLEIVGGRESKNNEFSEMQFPPWFLSLCMD